MLKRGAPVLLVLALMAGWVIGTSGVWAAGAPKAYVGLFKDDAVAVIDTGQNKVVGTISVPKGPHGLVVTPDGRKVYVSSDGASVVSVIDTANDRVVASIDVGATPHGLAVSGDGSRVLVMGWGSNRVLVIDTATDRVIGEVPVAQPHNGTLSRDGRTGWVASQQQGVTALARLDLTAWKETARVPLDKTPRGLELSPDGRRVFFTLAGVNAIQVLDTATSQIVAQIPVGASPHYAPFTPDGRQALAVVQGPGELAILDTASNTAAGAAATSSPAPGRATVAPAGQGKSVTRGGVTYADHGTKDVRTLSKLELEADDYYFSPTFLRGNPGQKLTLIVESEAATLHNLSIPALGIDKDIPPKGKVQMVVTFPASGVLAFFCKFHGPVGMNGQLLTGDTAPSGAR